MSASAEESIPVPSTGSPVSPSPSPAPSRGSTKCNIDLGADFGRPQLNLVRLGFTAAFVALGGFSPYMGVLYEMKGFSKSQNGLLSGVQPACTLFITPFACFFAQSRGWQVQMTFASVILSAFFVAVMCYAESTFLVAAASVLFNVVSSPYLPLYDEHTNRVLAQEVADIKKRKKSTSPAASESVTVGPAQQPVAVSEEELQRSDEEIAGREWGKFRVWGAYGWLAIAPAASALMSSGTADGSAAAGGNTTAAAAAAAVPAAATNVFRFAPLIFAIANVFFLYAVHKTPVAERESSPHTYLEILSQAAKKKRVLLFCAMLFILGIGYAAISSFLFVFLHTELGAPPILFGLSLVATLLVEIPLFAYSSTVYHYCSTRTLLVLAAAGWIFRGVGYSLLTNPWYVLLLEPAHGLTFGCAWLGGMKFMTESFDRSASNLAIGLLHACMFGGGALIGSIVSGALYEYAGTARKMFRLFALFIAVCTLLFYFIDVQIAPAAEQEAAEQRQREKEMQKDGEAAAAVVTASTDANAARQEPPPQEMQQVQAH